MVKLTLLRKQNTSHLNTWTLQVLSYSFPSFHLTDSQIKLLISASTFFISIFLFYKFALSLVLFCSFIKVSIPLKIVSIILNIVILFSLRLSNICNTWALLFLSYAMDFPHCLFPHTVSNFSLGTHFSSLLPCRSLIFLKL